MFRTLRVAFCALVLIGTMGATTKILGSADGEKSGSRIDITQLKRVSGNMVSLKFVLVNGTNDRFDIGSSFEPAESSPGGIMRDGNTIAGVFLVDASGGTKYVVVRDANGNCVCSSGVSFVPAKSKVNLWAKFPAPPDSVIKLTITVPHFQPVEDVPLKPLSK